VAEPGTAEPGAPAVSGPGACDERQAQNEAPAAATSAIDRTTCVDLFMEP